MMPLGYLVLVIKSQLLACYVIFSKSFNTTSSPYPDISLLALLSSFLNRHLSKWLSVVFQKFVTSYIVIVSF